MTATDAHTRQNAPVWPLWVVQEPPPRRGDRAVLSPDRSELPGQLAVCAADVHPEPPSAAPSPSTWCPPAIWSQPHLWRRCSALAASSTRPPTAIPGAAGPDAAPQGCGGTELLPDGASARPRGAGYGLFSLFSLYSSCNVSSPFGCTGRDMWYPALFYVSGWQGHPVREGISPDVPSQLGAKHPAPTKGETGVHHSPAHSWTTLTRGSRGCCHGLPGSGTSPGCHHGSSLSPSRV